MHELSVTRDRVGAPLVHLDFDGAKMPLCIASGARASAGAFDVDVTPRAKGVDGDIDDVALENDLGGVVARAESSADAEGGFERAQERSTRAGVAGKGAADDGDRFTATTGARGGYANGKTELIGLVVFVVVVPLRLRLLGAGFGSPRFRSRGRQRRLQTGERREGVRSPRRVVFSVGTDAKRASIVVLAASIASRRLRDARAAFTSKSLSSLLTTNKMQTRSLSRRQR